MSLWNSLQQSNYSATTYIENKIITKKPTVRTTQSKMAQPKTLTILSLYRPIFIYSKLFGCNNFRFPSFDHLPHKRMFSGIKMFHIIVMIAINVFGFVFHLRIDSVSAHWQSLILSVGTRFVYLYSVVISIFAIIWDAQNANQIWKILELLGNFDIEVRSACSRMYVQIISI